MRVAHLPQRRRINKADASRNQRLKGRFGIARGVFPQQRIRHYESATSGGNEFAQVRMAEHQKKFLHKWSTVLQRHYAPGLSPISAARIAVGASGLRILYVDDRIPHRNL